MSLAKIIKKKHSDLQKIIPKEVTLNGEAFLSINELGNLQIRCRESEIILSEKGVAELSKAILKWYGAVTD